MTDVQNYDPPRIVERTAIEEPLVGLASLQPL
jgi:hypothetical protein